MQFLGSFETVATMKHAWLDGLLKQRKIPQTQLSAAMNAPSNAVNLLIKGEREAQVDELPAMAKALNLSMEDLVARLTGQPVMAPSPDRTTAPLRHIYAAAYEALCQAELEWPDQIDLDDASRSELARGIVSLTIQLASLPPDAAPDAVQTAAQTHGPSIGAVFHAFNLKPV